MATDKAKPKQTQLQIFQDTMSKDLFGISKSEAHNKGICISCHQPAIPNCYSQAGIREYQISGLCEKCFDNLTETE